MVVLSRLLLSLDSTLVFLAIRWMQLSMGHFAAFGL